jgi:hypothetical protein
MTKWFLFLFFFAKSEPSIFLIVFSSRSISHLQSFNRKLPDIEKRLGTLQERLTDGYLDDETVQYLTYLLQFLQAKDYQNALGYHQYLVTSTNPDVTGAFLLGIKSLVNMAKALQC